MKIPAVNYNPFFKKFPFLHAQTKLRYYIANMGFINDPKKALLSRC